MQNQISLLLLALTASVAQSSDDVRDTAIPDNLEETFDEGVDFVNDTLEAHDWIYGLIFLVMGFVYLFFGWKLYKFIVFVSGFLVGFIIFNVITQYICLAADPDMSTSTMQWIAFAVGIVFGIPGGIIAYKCKKLSASIIGGLFGFVVGVNLDLVIQSFYYNGVKDGSKSVYPAYATWIVVIICICICAGLAVKLMKPAVIVMTACTGSFALLRGVGELSSTWPRSFDAAAAAEDIDAINFDDAAVWGYMAGMVVLAIVGIAVQCKWFGDIDHDDEDGEKEAKYAT